jgi:hypothetical protein
MPTGYARNIARQRLLLLLPLASGSLRPALHSLMLQVLSRIHRYGQKHPQDVTFLVAAASINKLLHDRWVGSSTASVNFS